MFLSFDFSDTRLVFIDFRIIASNNGRFPDFSCFFYFVFETGPIFYLFDFFSQVSPTAENAFRKVRLNFGLETSRRSTIGKRVVAQHGKKIGVMGGDKHIYDEHTERVANNVLNHAGDGGFVVVDRTEAAVTEADVISEDGDLNIVADLTSDQAQSTRSQIPTAASLYLPGASRNAR